MRFRKLVGAGKGIGFTRQPDPARYGLLAVWDTAEHAHTFLTSSHFIRRYEREAVRTSTLLLRTTQTHGTWNGKNPFLPIDNSSPDNSGPLCVLTRATIRPFRLQRFWQMVEPVGDELAAADGLLGSIGIGEVPFVRQATMSLWRDIDSMKAFAYGSGRHRTVVRRTRDEGWYSEDLFARFQVIEQIGQFP